MPEFLNYLKFIACVAILCVGWFGRGWYDDSKQLSIEKAIQATREASQKAAADEIAKIEIKNTTIIRNIDNTTYSDPTYNECRHTPENWLNIQKLFEVK